MNHTYRLVWNAVRQLWQCASENTRAKGKTGAVKAAANSQITPPPQALLTNKITSFSLYKFPLTLLTTTVLFLLANPVLAEDGNFPDGINGNSAVVDISNQNNSVSSESKSAIELLNGQNAEAIILKAIENNSISTNSDSKYAIQVTKPNSVINIVSGQGNNQILSRAPSLIQANGDGTVINVFALQGENNIDAKYLGTVSRFSAVIHGVNKGEVNIVAKQNTISGEIASENTRMNVLSQNYGSVNIEATTGNNIFLMDPYMGESKDTGFVKVLSISKATIRADNGQNIFRTFKPTHYALTEGNSGFFMYGIWSRGSGDVVISGQSNVFDFSQADQRNYSSFSVLITGIKVGENQGSSKMHVIATKGNNTLLATGIRANRAEGIQTDTYGELFLEAKSGYNQIRVRRVDKSEIRKKNNDILLYTHGVLTFLDSTSILVAKGNYIDVGSTNVYQRVEDSNSINIETFGVRTISNSRVVLEALTDNNQIILSQDDDEIPPYPIEAQPNLYAIVANTGSSVYLKALKGYNQIAINPQKMSPKYLITRLNGIFTGDVDSKVELQAKGNLIQISDNHQSRNVDSQIISARGKIILSAINNNELLGADRGIYSRENGVVQLVSEQGNNLIEATQGGINTTNSGTTLLTALSGVNQIKVSREQAKVEDSNIAIYGVYTKGENAKVTLHSKNNVIEVGDDNQSLIADSVAVYGSNNNDSLLLATIDNQLFGADTGVFSSVNGKVTIVAEQGYNIINTIMRGVDARNDGNIIVDGGLKLSAPLAAYSAGMVQLNYAKESQISGDLLANGGQILVKSKGSTLTMKGDTVAINQGVADIALTPNSQLIGRIDNANAQNEAHHTLFPLNSYAPAKPTPITIDTAGRTVLTLAKDSLWQMTGQSWVSELRGEGTVDVSPTSAGASAGQALHIDKLAGANQFLMTLNKTGQGSDMLYIKEGTSTLQDVVIKNERDVIESMNYGDRLRFATVQQSQNEFVAGKQYTDEHRLMKQALTVEYSDQATDPDNREAYNLAFNGGNALSKAKPGNEYVNTTYGGEGSQNVYLVKYRTNTPSRNTVDIGRMLDASAGYAFTLDTYTKREGERAYSLNDIKEGAWIRGTHTRLKETDRFSLNHNDYEIGYDKFRYNNDEKKQKWGLSFTYGYGKTTLADEFSKGRVKKYELSLYNTNQWNNQAGDNSYYNDNVLRVGALHNHYQSMMSDGNLWGKGSYKNYLFTASTEHGYRKFIDDNKRWYLVPQAQLQFAYLTGADYRTSNDIDVKLGHAKSLIGRAGVDIVRLLDESGDNRLYAKGNIMHEFLGKRSFSASDRTGDYHTSWNTRGTWYAVGVGYNAHVSEKTNVFIDAEKEFGHGRTGSYNLRLALSWQFK